MARQRQRANEAAAAVLAATADGIKGCLPPSVLVACMEDQGVLAATCSLLAGGTDGGHLAGDAAKACINGISIALGAKVHIGGLKPVVGWVVYRVDRIGFSPAAWGEVRRLPPPPLWPLRPASPAEARLLTLHGCR